MTKGRRTRGVALRAVAFAPIMMNSVSASPLDLRSVSGSTVGTIDVLDFADGTSGLFARGGEPRVPLGAPVLISGWAVDPTCDVPARKVAVVLDDSLTYDAEGGLSRCDVKALLGIQTPEMIGFRAQVPTEHVPPGDHTLVAYALAADDRWYGAARRGFRLSGRMLSQLPAAPRRAHVEIDTIEAVTPSGERGPLARVGRRDISRW